MLRPLLLPIAFAMLHHAAAQTGVKGVDVAEQDSLKTVPQVVEDKPIDGASAIGTFEVPPAHPDCDPLKEQERLDCTAARVLELIRSRNGAPRLDLTQFGGTMVTISVGVNQFGDTKDVRVDQLGDPQLHRNVTTALYALPTFKPALNDGTRTSATLIFRYPYEELFKQ